MTEVAVTSDDVAVAAHSETVSHTYIIAYPPHPARKDDPHYVDFEAYRKRTEATAVCSWGAEVGDFSECGGGLQLHHSHVEFAFQNGIDFSHLEFAYPGISDPTTVGAWVEGAQNLIWLCEKHHIGAGSGIHELDAADYDASHFVKSIFSAKSAVA
jgi:hypothetical protein